MSLKDELQIFLLTYNRQKELERTFLQLFADDSPIKDFDITILDNASSDDTQKLCTSYVQRFPNLKYIKNAVNIGFAGNAIKAILSANKKWLWILGDDDNYDWSAWPEIQQALNSKEDYDIVNTCWHIEAGPRKSYAYAFNETGFIATGIYNTRNIDDYVRQNMYYMAIYLNVHQAIGLNVLNKKGKFFIPQHRLVIETMRKNYSNIWAQSHQFPRDVKEYNVHYTTLKIYAMIKDKKLRYQCNEVLHLGKSFSSSLIELLGGGLGFARYIDVMTMLSYRQKLIFFFISLIYFINRNPLISFYFTENSINIRLFGKLKTKIIPLRKKPIK